MEFVPYDFIDSVICLIDREEVAQFQKLEGYWREAAGKESNHHIQAKLFLHPTDYDHWKYDLVEYDKDWTDLDFLNWDELRAENRSLVISRIDVSWDYGNSEVSHLELMQLLMFGYRKPLELEIHQWVNVPFTPQEMTQIAKLMENFNVWKIDLQYSPELHQFLVNAFNSRHLLQAAVYKEIPHSLHPHVMKWAHRDEFQELCLRQSSNFKVDFAVYERLVRRIRRKEIKCSQPLTVHFSEAAYAKIRWIDAAKWEGCIFCVKQSLKRLYHSYIYYMAKAKLRTRLRGCYVDDWCKTDYGSIRFNDYGLCDVIANMY